MNHKVLNYYFEKSGLTIEKMKNVSSQFEKILSGEKEATPGQIIKIAKKLDVPLGNLLLDEIVEEEKDSIHFRTIDSEHLYNKSRELEATIKDMRMKQEFLRNEIDYELSYISKYSIKDNHLKVANNIREFLKIENDYYNKIKQGDLFKFFRKKISDLGVFVFSSGTLGENTHRSLDLNEFRGFVLLDKKAPIIFINQKDSENGRVFTLIHELVHIFIGDEEVLGKQDVIKGFDPVEVFVNKVTAELLVPEVEFLENNISIDNIELIARKFKVSKNVIVRRMLDTRQITKAKYTEIIKQFEEEYLQSLKFIKEKKQGSTGNYKNNVLFKIDSNFFSYIESAIVENKITYTEAFRTLGVSYKGYKVLKGGK